MGRGKREFPGDAFISSESPAALFCWGRLFWFLVDRATLWQQLLFRCRVLASCCSASMLMAQTRFSLVSLFPRTPCLGGLSVPRPSLVFCLIRVRALADPLLNTGACALGEAPAGARRSAAPGWRSAFAAHWPSARARRGSEFSTVVIPAGVHVALRAALSVPSGKLASWTSWVSTGET